MNNKLFAPKARKKLWYFLLINSLSNAVIIAPQGEFFKFLSNFHVFLSICLWIRVGKSPQNEAKTTKMYPCISIPSKYLPLHKHPGPPRPLHAGVSVSNLYKILGLRLHLSSGPEIVIFHA